MIVLKPGREKSLLRRHPWVFSGAVARQDGQLDPGDTVEVFSSRGQPLGRGAYSPRSQILIRMWTFDPQRPVDREFFRQRLSGAVAWRSGMLAAGDVSACRLVNGESDGLPGLIVDRYGDYTVCQFLSVGVDRWKETIVSLLSELVPGEGVFERSDGEVRDKEGLPRRSGILAGKAPPSLVEIREGTCRFLVDLPGGHKTGFYLDQRENRALMMRYAPGADLLNAFSYTGGFAVAALNAGAERVTNVDSSESALELARRNMELNAHGPEKAEYVQGDVFTVLRRYREENRTFDLVVLDPPKFADSRGQLKRACRGYKDINLLAFRLLKPGGILLKFSCSGLLEPDLFQKIVSDAALDAGRSAQILQRLSQGSDHPVGLNFPEGAYLKGLVCRAA